MRACADSIMKCPYECKNDNNIRSPCAITYVTRLMPIDTETSKPMAVSLSYLQNQTCLSTQHRLV